MPSEFLKFMLSTLYWQKLCDKYSFQRHGKTSNSKGLIRLSDRNS